MSGLNPAWAASDPLAGGGGEPDPSHRTWDPEYSLKARPQSGPVSHDRHSLAYELREAERRNADGGKRADTAGDGSGDAPAQDNGSDDLDIAEEPDEAYRYEKQYHDWYYAQHPRDPRVPPPLGNPTNSRGAKGGQSGDAAKGASHPLAALRKAEAKKSTTGTTAAGGAPAAGGAATDGSNPPPLAGLGPVGGAPAAQQQTNPNEGSGRGAFGEASVSLPPPEGAAATSDDALEGSAAAAMWIDGLPLPTGSGSLNASAKEPNARRGGSRSSSRGSRDGNGAGKRRGGGGPRGAAPSPLLRQYREESAAGVVVRPASRGQSRGADGEAASTPTPGAPAGELRTPPSGKDAPASGTPSTARDPAKPAAGDGAESGPTAGGDANERSVGSNLAPPSADGATPTPGAGDDAAPKPFQEPYNPPRGVWDLTAVSGHIVEFACDQEGSRLIQQLAEDSFSLSAIFCEVHESLPMLVSHQFGNYCAQRLLELGHTTHKLAVMEALKGRMSSLAVDTYGCRVIQRALDTFTDDTVEEMVNLAHELDTHIPTLVIDQNGNHVVQKMMDRLPPNTYGTTALIEAFVGRMHDVGMHCYGCRVLQKLFETCGDGSKFAQGDKYYTAATQGMNSLIQDVLTNMQTLVMDQYGNYVVQHLIANGSRETRGKAIAMLTPRVAELAMNKFSSNAIERVLNCASDAERDGIVVVLSTARTFSAAAVPPIVDLTRDKFANYVVQRLIEHATPTQKTMLIEAIGPHINDIRSTTYGMHILSRLERIGWIPPGSSGVVLPMGGGRGGGRGRGRGGGRGGRGGGFGGPHGHHHHHHHHQGPPGMGHGGQGGPGMYQQQQQFNNPHHQHHHQHHQQQQQSPFQHQQQHGAQLAGGGQQQHAPNPYNPQVGGFMHGGQAGQQQGNQGGGGGGWGSGGGSGGNAGPQQQQQLGFFPQQQQQGGQFGGGGGMGGGQQSNQAPQLSALYAQQYASLQQQQQQQQQQQGGNFGGGGGPGGMQQQRQMGGGTGFFGPQQQQQQQPQQQQVPPQGGGWGAPQQQQQPMQSAGPGAAGPGMPLDTSRFSTDDLLAALAYLQSQQAGGVPPQGVSGDMQRQMQQQLQQQQQQRPAGTSPPPDREQRHHHDPYRPSRGGRGM